MLVMTAEMQRSNRSSLREWSRGEEREVEADAHHDRC